MFHETPARRAMKQFLINELSGGPKTYKDLRAKARKHGFGVKLMLLVADFLLIKKDVTGFGPLKNSTWSLPRKYRHLQLPVSDYVPIKKFLRDVLSAGPILENHLVSLARVKGIPDDDLFFFLDEIGARETLRKRRAERYSIWWIPID
jgi:hypothetical protein